MNMVQNEYGAVFQVVGMSEDSQGEKVIEIVDAEGHEAGLLLSGFLRHFRPASEGGAA